MTRLGIAVAAVALGAGCATARAPAAHFPTEGAALVVSVDGGKALEPDMRIDLPNPLACIEVLGHGANGGDWLVPILFVGCAAVVGAVDLVVLPVQATVRHVQHAGVAEIAAACPVEDPGERVGAAAAAALVREMGFRGVDPVPPRTAAGNSPLVPSPSTDARDERSRGGPSATAEPAQGDASAPTPPFRLLVASQRLSWSGRLHWVGRVALRDPDGNVVLACACDVAGDAELDAYRTDCARARQDAEVVARRCAESVAAAARAAVAARSGVAAEAEPAVRPSVGP